ncbi:MAG: ATP-binding cassette, subfamily multidrug efflux pump [Clostridiales bacterium]|nr:ATP-binding cassette, subfamily multidrug efflux pump [Clostridiales bacterium]
MTPFHSIAPFMKRYWRGYLLGTLILIVVDALQLITPLIIGSFTDALASGTLTGSDLIRYITSIMAIAIGVAIGRFGWRMTLIKTAKTLEYWLRNRVFEHLEKMSLNYFNHHKTGDLMAHCTNDITAIRNAAGGGMIMFVDGTFMALTTIIIMFTRIDAKLTVIALIPLPLIAIFIITLGRVVGQRFEKVQEAFSDLTDSAQETFSGIRIIKSFVQEGASVRTFNERNQSNFDKNMRLVKVVGFLQPMVQFISMLSTLIAIVYGGALVIDGVITVGNFVSFITYIGLLSWPMMAIGFVYNQLQRGLVSLKRINNILDTPPEIFDLVHADETATAEPALRVNGLTFTYPGAEIPALEDIHFALERGQTMAVVGKTGSGKTTLVNLLLRLYQVDNDMIYFGEKDINALPIQRIRDIIGYVPQDNFLFSQTVAYNLKFGDPSKGEAEIEAAAKTAQVYNEILNFPKGFKSELGERGVNMSGGQKQRVSIARALAKNPKLVILDDALSAVDTKTEEAILNHLERALTDTTTILIAHRISTIKHADLILVLDHGKIVERGTHSQLIEMSGIYRDMYEKQLLEDKLSKE